MNTFDFNFANESYFAASNGYRGFTSLFDKVFNPRDFTKIFIIKGGPGTGKSSLMKKLCIYAKECGFYTEAVFCSSDPTSLDGIIIKSKDKKIAFLDGTSPHTTDCKYPGAVEELLDLGEGFKTNALEGRQKDIITLNQRKSYFYSCAYTSLNSAGVINDKIRSVFKDLTDYNKAESIAKEICLMSNDKLSSTKKEILSSSFGKNGYTKFPFNNESELTKISISGNGHNEYILMNILKGRLNNRIKTLCYSPYRLTDIEAIYTENLLIYVSDNGTVNSNDIVEYSPDFTELKKLEKHAEEVSALYFKKAAEIHFMLEDIYINSTDFTNNDCVYEKSKNKIQKYLGI